MDSLITTEAVGDSTKITLILPNAAMEMFAMAARAYGWTPEVPDGKGGMKDNPISFLEKVFIYTIETSKMNAINMAAQLAAEEARKQKTIQMTAVADGIISMLSQ